MAIPVRADGDYAVSNFTSRIQILRNTDIQVMETIEADFPVPKHGIYRYIPVNTALKIISITDENGNDYKFKVSRSGKNIVIKIGDPNRTLTGQHIYNLNYIAKYFIRRFDDHDELYWNVTGADWDVPIEKAKAIVYSSYAKFTRDVCYAGAYGTTESNCATVPGEVESLTFESFVPTGLGSDFTIVVGLDKNNFLQFPTKWQKLFLNFSFWYLAVIGPALVMGLVWFLKGRDQKYIGDNVYYTPDHPKSETVPLISHPHLPYVYSPIDGLTPAEAGTIIDFKIDMSDVVAEIVELARLGFLKIETVGKNDYKFTKTSKIITGLRKHQEYLLNAVFDPEFATDGVVIMSMLKKHFYEKLTEYRKLVYQQLVKDDIFQSRPDKIVNVYTTSVFVTYGVLLGLFEDNAKVTAPLYLPIGLLFGIVAVLIASRMPRRTSKGYGLYRQLVGLKYFVGKGKWRYEIEEKRLFLDEILPLAIALGIVGKLARDMKELGLSQPKYMGNIYVSNFSSFNSDLGKSLAITPSGKYSSGWSSGGSGFSGGSSGGGGGGGGGGSW